MNKTEKGWQEHDAKYPRRAYDHQISFASLYHGFITISIDHPSLAEPDGFHVRVGGRGVSNYTRKPIPTLEAAKARALKMAGKVIRELGRELERLEASQ